MSEPTTFESRRDPPGRHRDAPASRFIGKRALVTGGSRGIGAAIARRLAAETATVTVTYVADASARHLLCFAMPGVGAVRDRERPVVDPLASALETWRRRCCRW